MSNSKIVLITGATAGIGRETALHLSKLGHHVIATGRRPAELAKLANEATGRLDTLLLDVTSLASITAAVASVDALTGGHGLDVLVNNAGFGVLGPTAVIDDAEMRRQYETNVFGLMNVTRAFLPRMLERRAVPYFGVYNSTKYAVESLSDAMRYELRAFGIDVALIEPGVIRTNFEAPAVSNLGMFDNTPYAKSVGKYEQMSKLADRLASNPIVIAKAIARAVGARRPAARYVAPFSTSFAILFAHLLPQRMWDWAMRRVGYLTPKALGLDGSTPAGRRAAAAPAAPLPVTKPESRVAAN
jgi:NAD(P)-dependent dehydrogenase (short-subunit alcohol dehydrogenase family)